MQESEASPTPREPGHASDTPPEGTGPISEADLRQHLRSMDGLRDASAARATATPEPDGDGEATQPRQPPGEPVLDPPRRRRGAPALWWWVAGAMVAVGALGTGALMALRANHFCASLGFCSLEKIEAVNNALAAARRTAQHLDDASSLKAYEADTAALEGQLQKMERDGLFSDGQRESMRQLREEARQARSRMGREQREQRIVRQVGAELDSRSPSADPSERQRRHWLQQLRPIAASSFSHREAQALRQRLRPPPPAPLPEPPSPAPWGSGSRARGFEPPISRRITPPAPPPAPPAAPPPAPLSGSGDNAPYRPVPLW